MICIAGKNQIAVEGLSYAMKKVSPKALSVCVNQNDTGEDGWQPSLRKAASEWGIPVLSLEQLYQVPKLTFFSLEFDRLIKPELFFDARLFNIHFSLLPKYRGMYTAAWPILNGEKESGVTLHIIDKGIDSGAVIAQTAYPLCPNDTGRDLYLRNLQKGTELFQIHFESLLVGDYQAREQNVKDSSYYSKTSIDYKNLKIDYCQTAQVIDRQIRAFMFPEYQRPMWQNCAIAGCSITDQKSTIPAGQVVLKTDDEVVLASLDYNMRLNFFKETGEV